MSVRKPDVNAARSFTDYDVRVDKTSLPAGIELLELL